MDENQHPLFFEARDLTDREKEKIWRHFQGRDSGGGECAMIEKVGGNFYKVSFKQKQDQERVLQRKIHTISIPGGELRLTMSQTCSPQTQDQPSTSQVRTCKPNANCLEKFLKTDVFLLYYLSDNPNTLKKIKKQLSAIGCTLDLDFKNEGAVVRGDIQKGAARAFNGIAEKWELQVYQIFTCFTENYLCHYVLEPKQVTKVLQDPSFVADDIKVYTGSGYAVVVGETDAVKEKIAILEKSLPTQKELPVVKKKPKPDEFNQVNQVSAQEVLNLQFPEMVDHFDKILKMIGMTQTNVSLKASHFPKPCVLLSGPLRLVKETHQTLVSALTSLTSDTLVLDGPGAQLYFQRDGKVSKELVEGSCHVLIWVQQNVYSTTWTTNRSLTPRPPTTRSRFNILEEVGTVNLEIKICSLEENQVNVLVAPMLNCDLTCTRIGKSLLQYGGNTLQSNFTSKAAHRTLILGEVLEVDASSSLGCSKIFFIECTPWDGVTGRSVQALRNGLRRCLDLCVQQGISSVAIPVIGPGVDLKYPLSEAVQALTETICQFGLSADCGSLTTIQIVIKPGYPKSEECYYEVYNRLQYNKNHRGRALFRSLTTDLDDVNMIVGGGAKLQVVFGDIINETTDAVVNTTNFISFNREGVCKAILTRAGTEVEAELKAANVSQEAIFKSKPGLFPCKALLHVCGVNDAAVVEQLVCSIIDCCERNSFESVAIPAICAGAGGMEPFVVADAILQGIRVATSSAHLCSLTTIRLVLIEMNIFLTFKLLAMQMFSPLTKVSVPQLPQKQQPPVSADLSILNTSTASQQSAFQFLGLSIKDVDDAMKKIKNLYEAQCSTQTFRKADLEGLTKEDMLSLRQLAKSDGLYVQTDPSGNLTVSGVKDGVNKLGMSLHGILREKVRIKEEDSLYSRVMWCILGQNGSWERLPKTANYNLEKKDTAGGIHDAHGVLWQVDQQNRQATSQSSGQGTNLKRLENLEDFIFPLYWDSMAASEVMKMVTLQPSSQEYQTVENGFNQTAYQDITKIQRLQNIHLRRAYEAQKKQLADKNKHHGGAGEKHLYHGTTLDNSLTIMKTGFNRRFAGQNATVYGEGTYFAVNARYSTIYSKPAADGSQQMFVVRVLTGIYTQGQHGLKVPPTRNDQSGERFDSVVNEVNDPDMYVIFHDDQAYPDYLVTFK